MMNEIEVEVFK